MNCQVIAFGGWLYPIAKWLPSWVQHHAAPLFGFSSLWCREFAMAIKKPTTLIGFSAGASAAMLVAGHSPMVRQAVIQSSEARPYQPNAHCRYRLFATVGDTTPTLDGTVETFDHITNRNANASIQFLPFVPFESPTFFERRQLARRCHIFHNVLPHLTPLGIV
jgi:hypothetical protein